MPYTPNGMLASRRDGNGNTTTYGYDGFDRLTLATYPAGGGFETAAYDGASNLIARRTRGGEIFTYGYNALNQKVREVRPGGAPAIVTAWDSQDRLWYTAFEATDPRTVGVWHNALGDVYAEHGPAGDMIYGLDAAGRRTSMTWPDGFHVAYDYNVVDDLMQIRPQGAYSGDGVIRFTYDDLGRRTRLARGLYPGNAANETLTTWGYDPASRLASITHDLQNLGGGETYDITTTFGYNAAGQMTTKTPSNALYASPFFAVADRTFGVNALNQITTNTPAGGPVETLGYTATGSLSDDGKGKTYAYTPERRLSNVWIDGVSKASLGYDPAGRLEVVVDQNAFASVFGYDGERLTTEYAAGGAVMRFDLNEYSELPLLGEFNRIEEDLIPMFRKFLETN